MPPTTCRSGQGGQRGKEQFVCMAGENTWAAAEFEFPAARARGALAGPDLLDIEIPRHPHGRRTTIPASNPSDSVRLRDLQRAAPASISITGEEFRSAFRRPASPRRFSAAYCSSLWVCVCVRERGGTTLRPRPPIASAHRISTFHIAAEGSAGWPAMGLLRRATCVTR